MKLLQLNHKKDVGLVCVCDISFTKAKCRSQKAIIFRMWFNSLLQHLLRCQHQPVSLGTIGWQGSRSPACSQRQCCAEGPGGQSTAAALGPEQCNTQSFCRQLVRPELLVPWKLAPELNGSCTIHADCQPLKTAMAPSKILARKPSYESRL